MRESGLDTAFYSCYLTSDECQYILLSYFNIGKITDNLTFVFIIAFLQMQKYIELESYKIVLKFIVPLV